MRATRWVNEAVPDAACPAATLSLASGSDDAPARAAARIPVTRVPDAAVPDAALVARVVASDDRHAFTELVRRHQLAVRALLRRLTRGNHALADDLAQETFLQVYRKLAQFRGDARFATWIYRVAYNCFLAQARSAHAEQPLAEDDANARSDGRHAADDSAMRLDVSRALATLPETERAAIIHCYYLDLSHEEAAYVLQCPLGTLKTHVLRGKQKLKRLLGAWAPADAGAEGEP